MRVEFTRRVANPAYSARPGQVMDLPEAEALKRIEAGHCTAVDQPKARLADRLRGRKPRTGGGQAPGAAQETPLEKMTVDQLKAYADEHDISLPPDGRKADLVAAIEAAQQGQE
ncbi:Rho termination factor N-terminal domain-containing protein [Streptomyces sp. G1]|uniref:Rho termination factor N-terminal domain-containing protein n=1 Tax=Streptomyces sp. G1 TaxID=361572 RepID=UPI00202EE3EE|nr:Rho termination factor N-terminal domain-containing protein [Streptomyces sp. G1]MCM1974628.1 Rho termination factor N-terminal domain-containing protein [Streptomyces sp. G1]